jgi:seryl-tRNA(Sec) selenium transferase
MNIESRKLLFIQEFLRVKNEEIIIGLEKTLKQWKSKQHEKELRPMSLEQFNDEIDQALTDSREDNVIKATELRKKWN